MIFQNFGFNSVGGATPKPPLFIEWLLVGGGGSSGRYTSTGGFDTGAGGAGRFLSSSFEINPQEIIIAIGLGGAAVTGTAQAGNNGQSSITDINGTLYIAPGGGGGGAANSTPSLGNGKSGGSGGGHAESGNWNPTPGGDEAGTGLAGFGNPGIDNGGTNTPASAGGGAGTGSGGRDWVDGVTYCIGGPQATSGTAGGTTAGCGGKGSLYSNPSNAGKDGIFIIRYAGSQKATGGTITSSGGYTYHTFTEDGNFVYE